MENLYSRREKIVESRRDKRKSIEERRKKRE